MISSTLESSFRCLPLPIAQLSLAAVLQCGQSFRWSVFPLATEHASNTTATTSTLPTHEYRLCLRDRVVCLRQTTDALHYRSVFPPQEGHTIDQELKEAETLAWINDYFQLSIDLSHLYQQWATRDPVFSGLKDRFSGIRILRQDPFECLLSFICSSNNNISRIVKMVKSLCKEYSPALLILEPPSESASDDLQPEYYHPFPTPSVLAGSEVSAKLRSLGFGYRADFIQKTARLLVDAHGEAPATCSTSEPAELWLKSLRVLDTATARTELLKFMGVGRKVADCVLLMSLDKAEVVPVDTHVHQIAVKHYKMPGSKAKTNMTPALYEQVNTRLVSVWGEYAGWAQSVLFTSDLKAFSSYGLTASPALSRSVSESTTLIESQPSSPSPRKRKTKKEQRTTKTEDAVVTATEVSAGFIDDNQEDACMADRVKRRRRGVTIPIVDARIVAQILGFTFPDGPFREVRLLVDGKIAGAANPYPVIFTGGILPTAWRPITSFGALDLPVYNIDLTPFVPVLADGNPHTITIDVVSAESDHTINQNWFVSGNLQVVTDPSGKPTKGSIDVYQANPFAVTSTTGTVSANGDVVVTVKASRTIHIESTIISGSGKVTHAVWSQTLSYTNTQSFLDNLLIQVVQQLSTSSGLGTHNGVTAVIDQYSFPFNVNITSLTPDGSTFEATFDHSYDRTLHPSPFILGSTISERQQAVGFFEETSSGNFGNGTNTNTFQYVDTAGNTLQRQVSSVNTTITSDHQSGSLAAFPAKLKVPDLPLSLAKFSTPRLPGGRKKFVPGN